MEIKEEKMVFKRIRNMLIVFVLSLFIVNGFSVDVFAESGKIETVGKFYEFGEDSHYEFHEKKAKQDTGKRNTYGTFFIEGNIKNVSEKAGVPSYEVSESNLDFYYNYSDLVLNAKKDDWHLVDDESKTIADIELDSEIMKGAILIQTSTDKKNWVTEEITCNLFNDRPISTKSIYSTKNIQLLNGCYYRVIIAYELSIRTKKDNFLFIDTDKYEYKKCAEVYEFYAYVNTGENDIIDSKQIYSLGKKVRTKEYDGYYGKESIDKGDIHYGWDLGNFFVSGYTDKVVGSNGEIVFLKNVGDRITLWFNLNQNIKRLNGKRNLFITADTEGYDQYFETPKMNFGKGVLITRYTDHNNIKADPIIYTNYLEANTKMGANTKVQLFEEGDYEVALDYQVTSDEFIDRIGHYRIFFKFSVRNGNCMVYPFDTKTGDELTNSSMTENGFRLDLAKSRYLKINLKRELLKDSEDGLVEDVRSNGPAKEGDEYISEGIYTITVNNEYTGQLTTKKIYVGSNNILRAHMKTGLSIPEINTLVEDGATILDDGTIQVIAVKPEKETVPQSEEKEVPKASVQNDENTSELFLICVSIILVVLLIVLCLKKKHKKDNENQKEDREGTCI